TTWPYDTTYGIDALEITVLTSLDHREIGWRANPFGFVFSLWSDSVFQQGYLRWNLIEFGFDYQVRDDTSRASVDTGLAFGYSVELGDGVALRVFEIGAYGGVYTKGEDA